MEIRKFSLGIFGVNNYLLYSEQSLKAILIDACEDVKPILQEISDRGLELVYLINTHGHGDHIMGNAEIIKSTGARLLVHPLEKPYLDDPRLNLSVMFGAPYTSPPPDDYVQEGDLVEADDLRLRVLHTPGHSPGHISLVTESEAFVGDVIFREGIGRTDFPGGDFDQLVKTIRNKIYALPDPTVLYNGHGPETTVGHEKKFNPFIRQT